jgi:hypothetical protein
MPDQTVGVFLSAACLAQYSQLGEINLQPICAAKKRI